SNDILTNSFANVKINTHDEIHELSESMKKMEAEINTRVAELMSTNRELITSQHLASEMTKLANKDALTGVGNKTAYEFALEKLKEDLKEGTIQEFGFIMIDLNDLKKNNDTFGHESGNEALKRLCKVVCEVFHHSPVYRIGGDEFVVLLKNRDYERAHHLIDKLYFIINKMNREEGLEASKVISAAVGLAKYDNQVDQTVEDVFNRADEEMYKTKRAMKGEAR
ncbi:MAG: GGDEF domain-containing protein, partial [Bacilli bacterium]|nr:GGDEF domain-containing protein [Bacilli bacterium]